MFAHAGASEKERRNIRKSSPEIHRQEKANIHNKHKKPAAEPASVEGLAPRFGKSEDDQGRGNGENGDGREAGRKAVRPDEIAY